MTTLSPGKLWGMRRKAAPAGVSVPDLTKAAPAGVSVPNHTHAAPRGARR